MKKKYILICSDEKEGTTDIVCDWLNYFNKSFIRISYFDKIKILNTKLLNDDIDIEFQINNQVYFLSEIHHSQIIFTCTNICRIFSIICIFISFVCCEH